MKKIYIKYLVISIQNELFIKNKHQVYTNHFEMLLMRILWVLQIDVLDHLHNK